MPAPRLIAQVLEEGEATSYTQGDLSDTEKRWAENVWANHLVRLLGGTNAEVVLRIASNTASRLVFASPLPASPEFTVETRYEILSAFLPSSGELTAQEQQVALLEDISALLRQIRFGLIKLSDVDLSEA